jgi:hypothetical protein
VDPVYVIETDVTSGYDVTSGSTEQQQQQQSYSYSNDEEPYYILKTKMEVYFKDAQYTSGTVTYFMSH